MQLWIATEAKAFGVSGLVKFSLMGRTIFGNRILYYPQGSLSTPQLRRESSNHPPLRLHA
jgi:hypothetical protein